MLHICVYHFITISFSHSRLWAFPRRILLHVRETPLREDSGYSANRGLYLRLVSVVYESDDKYHDAEDQFRGDAVSHDSGAHDDSDTKVPPLSR